MAKLNIAPTKSNLLAMKEQLAISTNGYELLEEKREILVKNNIFCYNIYTEKTVGSNCSEGTLMHIEKLRYEVFTSNRM